MKQARRGQQKPNYNAESSRLNELIRKAALTLDPFARIEPLANKAKIGSAGIRHAINRGYFTPGQAAALELAVGRELLPKEALCPKFAEE